jgi:hypothetical protein
VAGAAELDGATARIADFTFTKPQQGACSDVRALRGSRPVIMPSKLS